jgi:4-hydroxy-tetrahydrodipicolinate reductase
MRLGIIGYGKMGKMIEQIAKDRKHEVVSIIDIQNPTDISADVDCYIDFTVAGALEKNLPVLCKLQVPVVIGTTGWASRKTEYENLFIQSGNKGIWSSNFSLGVNLFWKVLQQASSIFNTFSKEYDVMVHEFHHKNKVDSPSGTALQTANIILENFTSKNKIVTESLDRKRSDDEIHVSSTRGGAIPGTHHVIFDSVFDSIELTHTARTREGFALGAVLAAEKIRDFNPGLFNFYDVFDRICNNQL